MLLPDVNVLIYAHRESAPDHLHHRKWLLDVINGPVPYGYSDLVLSGFVRIVTNHRVFPDPTPLDKALAFVELLRQPAHAYRIAPGPRHWGIFVDLCRQTQATGNLVPDAYLAALAIESDSEWITTDRDFAKFVGLRWRHPLE